MFLKILKNSLKKIMLFSFVCFLISCNSSFKEIKEKNINDKALKDSTKKEINKQEIKNDTNLSNNYNKIYFDFDSSEIKQGSIDIIEYNAKKIIKNNEKVLLEGNCDTRGTNKYNIILGKKRANSVKENLIKKGVSEKNINIISNGKLKAESGNTEEIHQRNRNVTFFQN